MARERRDVRSIFDEAAEIASPGDRAAYLDRACGGDVDLRREVDAKLRAQDEAGSFLEATPALDAMEDPDPPADSDGPGVDLEQTTARAGESMEVEPAGATGSLRPLRPLLEGPGGVIGPYKLLQKIGEGGMGAVFMAEQERPVRRKVALKVIKPGMDSGRVIARFEAERQALAMMDHPNIAKVLDAGATETGRPYFVMELVRGVPITEYCDRNHLTPRERLELFIPVCQAIQHAHQKGIIHRDIKPSNVLVTLHDGVPVPKVIDFGVAKAIDQRLTERTMFTEFGAVIGTLEYMSPEQAEMGALDIDTRSDIYSLGVMLYELLTGSTPLERAKLRKAAYAEVLRRIIEEEPTRPSTRLSESKDALASISTQRKMEPARLTKLVRGDLDWIVMKSLEKDRTRRYETANGFAQDIRRYLDGDAVEACPPSASYRLKKFARKHRVALTTAGAFAFLLVAATAVSVGLALWADRERVRAVNAEHEAKEQKRRAEEQKGRAEEREQMAIDAVKRFNEVIRDTPELKDEPALAPLRARLLKEPQAFFQRLREQLQADRETTPGALARLASANYELGNLTNQIGDKQEAGRSFEESLAIRERLARDNPSIIGFQSDLAAVLFKVGYMRGRMGRPMEAREPLERALAIRERLARENPQDARFQNDLAYGYAQVGYTEAESGRPEKALALYEQFRAIMERLARDNPSVLEYQRGVAQTYGEVATILRESGRLAEALALQDKAHAIRVRLARENPRSTQSQFDLAWSYNKLAHIQIRMGRSDEALASHERALAIRERLARDHPSVTMYHHDLAWSYHSIAHRQRVMGRMAEALESVKKALAIMERLARDNPSVPAYWAELADAQANLAASERKMGRTAEALAAYEQALATRERLVRDYPAVLVFRRDLAVSHDRIGDIRRGEGRTEEALASYEKAVAIKERLARDSPSVISYQTDLVWSCNTLARLQGQSGQPAEAVAWHERVLAIRRRLARDNPSVARYRRDVAQTHHNIGIHRHLAGRLAGAMASFEEGRAIRERLARDDPSVIGSRDDLGWSHDQIGRVQYEMGRPDEAHGVARADPRDPRPAGARASRVPQLRLRSGIHPEQDGLDPPGPPAIRSGPGRDQAGHRMAAESPGGPTREFRVSAKPGRPPDPPDPGCLGPGPRRRGRRGQARAGRPPRLESELRGPRCSSGGGPRREGRTQGRARANPARLSGL